MAVTKKEWLDPNGIQTMSELLYKSINSRIKERIATAITDGTSGTINSRTDDNHTLSSKVILGQIDAINEAIGDAEDDSTDGTLYGYVNGIIADIGDSADVEADGTVYGYINGQVEGLAHEVRALNHLTYQVVQGDIETEVPLSQAKRDVIYLQHDDPTFSVGNDGYLLDENGAHAVANDGENNYNAWMDPTDGKIYKMVAGVKGSELDPDAVTPDPIFAEVALVDDDTYNLYVIIPTAYNKNSSNFLVKADGTTLCSWVDAGVTYYAFWDAANSKWMRSTSNSSYVPTDPASEFAETDEIFKTAGIQAGDWLCVGDTSLDLENYWNKTDADVATLRDLIMEPIGTQTITNKVQAAFNNTDPYAANGAGYMDSWMS